jgi:hypothetical protein
VGAVGQRHRLKVEPARDIRAAGLRLLRKQQVFPAAPHGVHRRGLLVVEFLLSVVLLRRGKDACDVSPRNRAAERKRFGWKRYLQDFGKSPQTADCVVELGGLEPTADALWNAQILGRMSKK